MDSYSSSISSSSFTHSNHTETYTSSCETLRLFMWVSKRRETSCNQRPPSTHACLCPFLSRRTTKRSMTYTIGQNTSQVIQTPHSLSNKRSDRVGVVIHSFILDKQVSATSSLNHLGFAHIKTVV